VKYLCPSCERLVELRDFKLEGAALVVTCPACQVVSRTHAPPVPSPAPVVPLVPVTSSSGERPGLQLTWAPGASNVVALRTPGAEAVLAAAEAAKSAPFAVPEGRCPKCVAPRTPENSSCPQCGLTFTQFDPAQVEPPEWLKGAWVELLSHWDDEPRHLELRRQAVETQDLASLGRLYRLRLVAQSEDPIAQRGRDEVLRLALIPNTPTQPSAPPSPKWKYLLLGLVLLLCLLGLAMMARRMLEPSEW
jgi:hypothetical protein